jgi:hypothetical protein
MPVVGIMGWSGDESWPELLTLDALACDDACRATYISISRKDAGTFKFVSISEFEPVSTGK